MNILAIETSCDETAVAVVKNGRWVLSSLVLSQADMHSIYGGVVPELASRQHTEAVFALTQNAIAQSGLEQSQIDAVAVTYAPGLIGALLVGVNFAKGLAVSLGVPLIPVHHIHGHIAANYIAKKRFKPPFLAVVASGGHTLIAKVEDFTKMSTVATTRDDACGEAFDKVARTLSLPYPGGAQLEKLALHGDPTAYKLPRASIEGSALDMSFSGLKTAVLNIINQAAQKNEPLDRAGLAASFCAAVCDTLVPRAVTAAKQCQMENIAVAGGVFANSILRGRLQTECDKKGIALWLPPLWLCGDNAAMIGAQAYFEYKAKNLADSGLNAVATMEIDRR